MRQLVIVLAVTLAACTGGTAPVVTLPTVPVGSDTRPAVAPEPETNSTGPTADTSSVASTSPPRSGSTVPTAVAAEVEDLVGDALADLDRLLGGVGGALTEMDAALEQGEE